MAFGLTWSLIWSIQWETSTSGAMMRVVAVQGKGAWTASPSTDIKRADRRELISRAGASEWPVRGLAITPMLDNTATSNESQVSVRSHHKTLRLARLTLLAWL